METLRKDKGCWAQVGDDYCKNNAVFGSTYCQKHYDEFNEDIKGSDIERVVMIGSMYNNNSFIVYMKNGDSFRMKGEDVLPILQKHNYITKKAKVHSYLALKFSGITKIKK